MATFDGEVALVTGAAGGLGSAIALALHSAGARIALVDRDESMLEKVLAEFPDDGRTAAFAADLADDEQTAALPHRVEERLSSVDLLVNNAGVRQIAPLLDVTPEQWRHTIDVDLTGPFVLSRAVLPGMLSRGRGKIVNIASMAGQLAFQNRSAYCSAKAGLIMLTKAVAYEYGAQGIWCNAVAPGVVETPLTSAYFQSAEMRTAIEANTPMGRWGQPPEIADPVLFLAGPGSDYINGTTVFVDGGWTAGKGY